LDKSVDNGPLIKIEGHYGLLKINGMTYDHDVIIHTNGEITRMNCGCSPELRGQLPMTYANDYFHAPLAEWDLDFLEMERLEVVIIGSGFKSMLPLKPKAKNILARYDHKILSTPEAIVVLSK
jgi:hypothetical protein